jgi:Flp pilus assembly protein TadD/outer membrane protein OmpA-like peptidoglycan-associated protein
MKKHVLLLLPAASALLMVGCGGFGKITSEDFTVTPTPLEYVSGEVPATISANIPAKFMPKKGVVTCTPVLKWEGGQATGTPATFQGESVEGNNTTISYKNGGTATMRVSYPYQQGMAKSELYMQFDAKKGSKEVKIPEVKIGYGVQATAALISEAARTSGQSVAADKFQRIISQKQEAAIKFLINQANLRGSELNSSNVKDFIAKMKEIKSDQKGLALKNVEVSAYASPDGKYDFNEKLAEKRGDVSEKYVNQQLKAQQLATNVDMKYTAEDWDGFKELVSQSNLQDKQIILRVLSMYQDPEQREQEIRNVATVYKELADAVLPELRRSRLTINYDVIGRSDTEIVDQFKADATKLSLEELLYAGNKLALTNAEKEAYYKKATDLYQNDYRAYNNLGVLAMQQGDANKATNFFKQALSKDANAPEPNANMSTIALQNGDFQAAETYASKGTTAPAADETLGNLYIAQGKYEQAATKLANSNTNSAALAQILSKNYTAAQKTLDKIKDPNALTFYLKAIVGARQNEESVVLTNLKQAVQKDSHYRTKAQNDCEFVNFPDAIKAL